MLMNIRELLNWLDEQLYYCYEYSIDKHYTMWCDRPKNIDYERIGIATVWNDVGSIEYNFDMYRPVGGGTVYYFVSRLDEERGWLK